MRQDANLYSGLFDTDEAALLPATRGRTIYVHVARGDIDAKGISPSGGDVPRIVDNMQRDLNGRDETEDR